MRSMTGYGRAEQTIAGWLITIELGAVNRKQSDIVLHLPPGLSTLEPELKKQIGQSVLRGRVTARISIESAEQGPGRIALDEGLAGECLSMIGAVEKQADRKISVSGSDLLRVPGVFTFESGSLPAEELGQKIENVLGESLNNLIAMQEAEGTHLEEDLEERLEFVENKLQLIATEAPQVVESHRRNLHKRLEEGGLDVDLSDERLLREIALFADRCDISEEITRARSHINQFRAYMASADAVGRSLDFLCQELNREINTIGSKANNAHIAQHVVEAKTELEKVREQVQNIQ